MKRTLFFSLAILLLASSSMVDAAAKNQVNCTACKVLVHDLANYITDPQNEAAVGESLQQICSVIFANDPVMMGTCQAWIVEYADDIIELITNQYLDPESFCNWLNACP